MTQLFNNEYFGIGLIVTIAFLTVLFIIVLIMALKDAKKRSEEIQEKDDKIPSESFAFKEEEPKQELQIPEVEEEKVEIVPTIEEKEVPIAEASVTSTPEIKEEVEIKEENVDDFKTTDFSFADLKTAEEEVKEPTVNIDFAALAESLKNELDAEVNKESATEGKEEIKAEDVFTKEEDIPAINLEELKRFASELQAEEKPLLENEEETIKVENNTTDNVYLNKEEEKVVKEEKVFEPVKMKVPDIVMPKFASAPNGIKVEKVEPVEDKKEEVNTPSFENIENETFSLK